MAVLWRLLTVISMVSLSLPAFAQSSVDPFEFLEEWDLLSQDFSKGGLELTPEGLPPGFNTDVSKPSEDGHFQVSIKPKDEPAPMNEIHSWLIEIKTQDGLPVTDADVSFFGGMPLHRHGFPTDPRIVSEIDPGVYSLEGVKFSMAGWWAIGMGIVTDDRTDRVAFNLVFEP